MGHFLVRSVPVFQRNSERYPGHGNCISIYLGGTESFTNASSLGTFVDCLCSVYGCSTIHSCRPANRCRSFCSGRQSDDLVGSHLLPRLEPAILLWSRWA